MKKPYVKKIGEIADFKIWRVDGEFIRTNIDEEFTNFGQHYRFGFIPKKEFWLDYEHVKGEEKYYISHLLVEYRLMEKGMNYNSAVEKADMIERKERKKSKFVKRIKNLKHKQDILNKIHKKLLKEYSNGLRVWIVNGGLVRSLFYTDFTEGGHDLVYNFVPKNEVWIDDDLKPNERDFVILHEVHERNLMSAGLKYNDAHKDSSRIEFLCRKNPCKTRLMIKKEILNSKVY